MKNRKITFAVSLMLVFVMLFGTVSVAAVEESFALTTAPLTTTAPAADDEEKSDDYWDGYYDGYYDGIEEIENEDYESGYEDGYYDGLDEGYWEGYYEGYYDGVNDVKGATVFDRIDDFIYEFRYRIEEFLYNVIDFFERLFKTGDYAEPTYPDNTDFIPDSSQDNLADSYEAALLCLEFNDLINSFMDISEPVTVTKNVDVGVQVNDLPAVVTGIANSVIEQFVGTQSVTNEYEAGDYAGNVQPTDLYPEGVKIAEKTVNEDGTTDYKFVLIAEAAYYDGQDTYGVELVDGEIVEKYLQHEDAADAIYIEYADLDPITITYAEIYYPGATITAKTDANGRLIAYDVNMPVEGTGVAKVGGITVTANIEGYRNEGFVMEYAN